MSIINEKDEIIKKTAASSNDGGENLTAPGEIPASIISESENVLPMVAMKGLVIFPNIATSFNVGRTKSLAALSAANSSGKNRTTAALMAFFLGGFGGHQFYLGNTGKGILYLVFCWTYIPSIIGFIEGIMLITQSDEDFDVKPKLLI